jgi:hypothetical protein
VVLRVIRKKYSFPHEGDLLTSLVGDHLFRCNKNCVDIFNAISGQFFQQITMRKPRHMIERTQFIKNFYKQDCFALATNHGNFYIYAFQGRYKLIYEFDSEKRSIYHLVYENQLAEEGFFCAIWDYDTKKSTLLFQDINRKVLIAPMALEGRVYVAKKTFKRDGDQVLLTIFLGFDTGGLNILRLSRTFG